MKFISTLSRYVDAFIVDIVALLASLVAGVVVVYSVVVRQPIHVDLTFAPFSLTIAFDDPPDNP